MRIDDPGGIIDQHHPGEATFSRAFGLANLAVVKDKQVLSEIEHE